MTLNHTRHFLFDTLRGRLVTSVALVHAVMMALFIADLTARQRVMLLDRQAEEAVALAQSLSTSAGGWLAANDISGLQELVEAQRRYPELMFAMLIDKEGKVLAHSDRTRKGFFAHDLPAAAEQTLFSRTPALVDVAVPAMLGGRHVGWARIGLGQKSAREKLAAITGSGILYAIAAILIGSIIAWWMGYRITRRLYAVQETINLVRAGDRQARSHLIGKDEAALMAGEFNAMLDALDKSKQEIMRLNSELELRVQQRTAELETAYQDLKMAQAKILQQDKMASIGQLAAGVAHEINNPMGFILSNLGTLAKYSSRLVEFIGVLGHAVERVVAETDNEVRQLIDSKRQALKINQIIDDIGDLIAESIEGGTRIKQIVMNLKGFSHIDKAEYQPADINAALSDTLAIVGNELKRKAQIHTAFGDLTPVTCHAGQLNQVFTNILLNAAQSITGHGEITIETKQEGEAVTIVISDTGSGMPPEVISRVFEPFYTTREVGQGTGLGLSIAYDIVKKHQGTIEVASRAGQGTAFTITLPLALKTAPETMLD